MDYLIFQTINQLAGRWPILDEAGIFLAEYLGYVLAIIVILLFFKKWKIIFLAFLAAVVARFGIVELIRWFWVRPRPFAENNVNLLLGHENTGSFPSGHAAFFFALSFVVYRYNKKTGIIFLVASSLIIISRVFVGVHWFSDVLAGAVVGMFCGWLICKIFRK